VKKPCRDTMASTWWAPHPQATTAQWVCSWIPPRVEFLRNSHWCCVKPVSFRMACYTSQRIKTDHVGRPHSESMLQLLQAPDGWIFPAQAQTHEWRSLRWTQPEPRRTAMSRGPDPEPPSWAPWHTRGAHVIKTATAVGHYILSWFGMQQ
jgi:hypothetical protein